MQPTNVPNLETIAPFCLPPWQSRPKVTIPQDRIEAIALAKRRFPFAIYTDGTLRNGLGGTGIAWPWPESTSTTIGPSDNLNRYVVKLIAIDSALRDLERLQRYAEHPSSAIIFSDSQCALEAINNTTNQSCQYIVRSISDRIESIRKNGLYSVVFQWAPRDSQISGNKRAREAAHQATEQNKAPVIYLPKSKSNALKEAKGPNLDQLVLPTSESTPSTRTNTVMGAAYTRSIDKALPGKHTKKLYDNLRREEATVLAQLRTGMCRLNVYLAKIRAIDGNTCSCTKEVESVSHYLFRCQLWEPQRDEFRKEMGTRWGDVSFALGGWSGRRQLDGLKNAWTPNMAAVRATIAFARATKRLDLEEI